jgi:general secretion pathway protein N
VQLQLSAPCCTPEPLAFTVLPGLRGAQLKLAAFQSQWPTGLLIGLGTPWNTLRLEGRLGLQSPGLSVQWQAGSTQLQGALTIEAIDMASRLSTLRPLGSYRIGCRRRPAPTTPWPCKPCVVNFCCRAMANGWVGNCAFGSDALSRPGREEALANLLNIIGRRQGPRSLLNIG